MKRKGPQKHSNEVIQSAITKLESGARLATISRELGVPKNTVKYWLDNANKYLPDSPGRNPTATRIKKRLTRESWDIIFAALKEIKKKLADAPMRDLVTVIGELFDRQAQFGSFTGNNRIPQRVMEVSQETRLTVREFLKKKQREKQEQKTAEKSQSGSGIESSQPLEAEALPDMPKGKQSNENGAT